MPGRDSPVPGSSRDSTGGRGGLVDHGLGPGFQLRETASFLNGLPPEVLGKEKEFTIENSQRQCFGPEGLVKKKYWYLYNIKIYIYSLSLNSKFNLTVIFFKKIKGKISTFMFQF